jgi:hypothetical protein
MDDAGFEHDVVHTNHSGAIIALETKVGIGSSSAVADSVLAGTGSGTSGWSTAPSLAGLTVDTDTLHVDAANDRVGIGTTSPGQALVVEGRIVANHTGNAFPLSVQSDQSTSGIILTDAGTTSNVVLRSNGNDFQIRTNSGNRVTVDSSGNVGIGTTTPNQVLDVDGALSVRNKMVIGTSTFTQEPWSASTIAFGGYGSIGTQGSFRASWSWNWERGTDSGWHALGINSYTSAAGIEQGNDGILFRADATYGATAPPTTRMILTPAGNVGIGTTGPGEMLEVGSASNYGSFRVHAWKGSESFRVTQNIVRSENIKQLTTSSAANVYVATSNGTMYRSTSSIKYKTDVETMGDEYADAILGLRPVWYRSLGPDDPASYGYWGFIAEEVAEVDPRLVNFGVPEDYVYEYDDDGERVDPAVGDLTEPEGVQYDRLVPHLVNLLKRHEARIAALEAA